MDMLDKESFSCHTAVRVAPLSLVTIVTNPIHPCASWVRCLKTWRGETAQQVEVGHASADRRQVQHGFEPTTSSSVKGGLSQAGTVGQEGQVTGAGQDFCGQIGGIHVLEHGNFLHRDEREREREPKNSIGERWSDLSLTNSLATSSLLRWDRMRSTVRPVSSMWMRFPRGSQQATLPRDAMSFSCSTAMPTVRSSRAKQ
ncbi:hypothetical protein JZ751_014099 [Albula glossodonta]|uniref:Uncharacterized protein n=1 Tax=Albula glossodonta TaxID=121402 RepID=A0A8T2P3B4_9TELE|nr:hypothetical protein JZ751_014099 [Albula glossodonta]